MADIDDIKDRGEDHYKTGGVEQIDLLSSIHSHPSLHCGEILALTSLIRYASRMLMRGTNETDIEDCITYSQWLNHWRKEKADNAG